MNEVTTRVEEEALERHPLAWRTIRRITVKRGFLLHWSMLFGFWLVLSGMFDPFHVGAGVIASWLVAVVSYDMQFVARPGTEWHPFHLVDAPWHRLFVYFGWLFREVAVANWEVLKIVLDPKLPIDPAMIRFRSRVTSDLGETILANSITLTPGTITVDVVDREFIVHALVGREPVVVGIQQMETRILEALPGVERSPAPLS